MSEKPTYEELKRRVRQLEKHQAERELSEKRLVAKIRRLEDIVDAASVGTWEWNVRTGAIITNERWARILGYGLEEMFPATIETWRKHVHPEDLERNLLALQAHFQGDSNHYERECRMRHKDGSWVWVLERGKVTKRTDGGEPLWMYGTRQNITERRRAETKLKESEKFLKDVVRAASIGIAYTKNRKIVWANEAMEQLFGYEKEEEYLGMDTAELFADKEDYDRVGQMLFEQNRTRQIQDYATTWVRKDGAFFDGYVRVNLIDVNDYSKGVITSIFDITARKQAEEALRKSEEKYRVLVENASDAIFIAQDGTIRFANKRTLELFGYETKHLYSVPFGEHIHPEDREMVVDRHFKRLKGDTGLPSDYSFRLIGQDGSIHTIQLSVVLIEWEGKPATLNFARDITEMVKLEKSLYHAQKMEAIGTLAGGIAHDFNNLLTGIQGRASLLSHELPPSDRLRKHSKAIEEYATSATALTKQLLGLARGGQCHVEPVDIDELVQNTAAMFGRTRKELRIQWKTHPSPVVVDADKGQIEQLLLNLLINAWQAMPDGGEIFLATSVVDLDEAACTLLHIEPGRYCRISVADTGIGMDESVMQRIFDPFFTTKPRGMGTGLGLASAFGIAKNHGGAIAVRSEPGKGSTFETYLPVSKREAVPKDAEEEDLRRGSATILLVDDEEMILEVGGAMLESLGYDVITAHGGEEAIKALRQKDCEVDLVILDMIMPGFDGGKAFDCIRELKPGLPVILSSGYSMEGKAAEILKRGCDGFLQKPFKMADLGKKASEILTRGTN